MGQTSLRPNASLFVCVHYLPWDCSKEQEYLQTSTTTITSSKRTGGKLLLWTILKQFLWRSWLVLLVA